VLFATNGYLYNGKTIDSLPIVAGIVDAIDSIVVCVVVSYLSADASEMSIANAANWAEFGSDDEILEFESVEFNHPLYIMYSYSISKNMCCIPTFLRRTVFSISPPAAG
jgi:acetoacetyl-CoA synthetase